MNSAFSFLEPVDVDFDDEEEEEVSRLNRFLLIPLTMPERTGKYDKNK